jgi:molybdopterin-containing oxidoreductase family membrane subunit
MDGETRTAAILRPLGRPSSRYLVLLAVAVVGVLWFAYAWAFQLKNGMVVTGLSDWGTGGGVPWGLYVGSFIWWVGIAHGGIIVSASVRLFGIDSFRPVARLAELLTIAALTIAALYILLHLGRPGRVVTSVLPALPTTYRTSPLAWDVIVITAYFVLTATYLGLTVRADLYALRKRLPRIFTPVYWLMLLGYRPDEDEKVERMAWWLALAVIVLAPLFLHGGVIPWLFALLPGTPNWAGAGQGPVFLTIALSSALGSIIILAYVVRRAYGWEEILDDRVFAGLARFLALFALLFLWMQLQEVLTGVVEEPLYWVAIGMMAAALAYFSLQMLFPRLFSVERTVAVALLPVLGTLIEKTMFVLDGLRFPAFSLYEGVPGGYSPSWVEVSTVFGAVSLVVLFFLAVSKVLPMIEVGGAER